MKKILFFLLALWVNSTAFAHDIYYEGLCYNIISETDDIHKDVKVTYFGILGDSHYSGEVNIPEKFIQDGILYTVKSIGSQAFQSCSSLTSITIPSSVTSIENYAFSSCPSLTSITIPSSVTSIGYRAFSGCSSLSSVTILSSVTSIGDYAFHGCSSLFSVTIPEGVTSIGSFAFLSCSSLSSVTIPEGVTSIGYGTFEGCSSLSSVTIPEGVTSIGNEAFYGCSGLTSVTIPEGVTSIGSYAFYCSGLTSVTIPEGVTSIGSYAFEGCSSLTSVTIPSSVTNFGEEVFHGSGLTNLIISEGVTSIGYKAFKGCSGLTSVTIPSSMTSIGDWAFSGCSSLSSVTIPEGVTSIGDNAFYYCISLSEIYSKMKDPCACPSGSSGSPILYVPAGTADKYIAQGWDEWASELVEINMFNTLEVSDTKVVLGATTMLPVYMTNEESITAFQFEVSLPEGVTMTGYELSSRKAADHSESFTLLPNGNYQVTCLSLSSKAFSGTEGLLANLQLAADKEITAGDYEVSLKNIELSTTANKALTVADITATLTVSDVKIGDTNGDGRISITDAVAIVNFILGKSPANYVAEASDVNGDGRTSITDAVAIVNKILSGETEAKTRMGEALQGKADLLDPQ